MLRDAEQAQLLAAIDTAVSRCIDAFNVAAETDIDFPILRGIASGIAMSRAEEMRPESEAIAASRVRERVLPAFNAQVDQQFRELNPKVAARWQALRDLNLRKPSDDQHRPDRQRQGEKPRTEGREQGHRSVRARTGSTY